MNITKAAPAPLHIVRWTYATFAMLLAAWIAAWLVKVQLDATSNWSTGEAASFVYWTSAKLVIWLLPALWLIRLSGRTIPSLFRGSSARRWLFWGGGIGLAVALTDVIPNVLAGRPAVPTHLSYGLINAVLIAPVFEEFLMRGAVLGNLQQRYSFWRANVITSGLFLLLHLPGWFFLGNLAENLTRPLGGAASIFFISLLFGYAVHRSGSLMGGILAHFLNNLV